MSDYIIDPSWFYWASVCQAIKILLICAGACGTALLIIITATAWDDLNKKKSYWVGWIASLLALVCGMFIPSKEVMMQMMVARFLTHENMAYSVETIKEIADYILQAVGKGR